MRFTSAFVLSLFAIPAAADVPRVVTDTPVVQSLTALVMGDLGSPDVLLGKDADPHSFQLRPSQARALGDADLIFWVGEALTPALGRSFGSLAGEARIVELLDVPGLNLIAFDDDHGDHGHGMEKAEDHDDHGHEGHGHDEQAHDDHGHDAHGHDEHGHDDHGHEEHAHDDHAHDDHGHDDHSHDAHGHDDHAHGPVDVHAWLDPANAVIWIDTIAASLGEADPANAEVYLANAAEARGRIEVLSASVAETLAPVAGRPIVVFHDAYDYFARRFDVTIAGSVALGDAAAPGVRRLRALAETVEAGGVECVFREPQHDASLAERIAADAGIRLGTLDPAGSSLDFGAELYFDLMQGLADSIAGCLTRES